MFDEDTASKKIDESIEEDEDIYEHMLSPEEAERIIDGLDDSLPKMASPTEAKKQKSTMETKYHLEKQTRNEDEMK